MSADPVLRHAAEAAWRLVQRDGYRAALVTPPGVTLYIECDMRSGDAVPCGVLAHRGDPHEGHRAGSETIMPNGLTSRQDREAMAAENDRRMKETRAAYAASALAAAAEAVIQADRRGEPMRMPAAGATQPLRRLVLARTRALSFKPP